MSLKTILNAVFFEHQENNTMILTFTKDNHHEDLTDKMSQMKNLFNNMGISIVTFVPDNGTATVVTTPDREKDVLKVAQDFNTVVTFNGFEQTNIDRTH